jgi:hypothetical protein
LDCGSEAWGACCASSAGGLLGRRLLQLLLSSSVNLGRLETIQLLLNLVCIGFGIRLGHTQILQVLGGVRIKARTIALA